MSKGVPAFGVWNDPNAENIGFTGNFDMMRKVKREKPPMHTMDANSELPKRPATSSGISERMRREKLPLPVEYDRGEIWETQSAKSPTKDFEPQIRQSWRPVSPIERRHDLPPAKHHNVIGEGMRNNKSQFPVRHDRGEIWETQSAGTPHDNYVPQIRPSPKHHNRIGERMRNEKPKGEIWETQSERSPEDVVPQIRQSQRPPIPNERRKHVMPPANHQSILTGQDDPRGYHERSRIQDDLRGRYERPRTQDDPWGYHEGPGTGVSSGSASVRSNFNPEARHHRLPSSSSDGSRQDLLSSREEEYTAKERNTGFNKPKGPAALTFGKWNVDPNSTQQYTMEFAIVRDKRENKVVEPLKDPAPPIQPSPQIKPTMYYVNAPQKKKKGKPTSCLDFLFPRVKTAQRRT